MLRDAVRTELGRAGASRSAAAPGTVKLLPSPDFQDPTPIASSGARNKELGQRRRPTVVALLIGLLVLLGGFVIWTRARSPGPASDGAPPPGKELVPAATEAHPAPPPSSPPALSATAPPPEAASAAPTPPEKPAVVRAPAGGRGSKPAPVKTSSPAPPAKPNPGGGEDLANPYR